jgi:hypothetical protein
MRATGKIALAQSKALKPCRHTRGVHRFAGMGCAGKRDMFIVEAERICRARFDKRQGLHGLQRRARINRRIHIAKRESHRTARIGNRYRAAMDAFDKRSACDLYKDRIRHGAMLHL